MSDESIDQAAIEELRRAFDDMIEGLRSAREAIDDPALWPPPSTNRNLAEGYRYLIGYVHGVAERAFAEDVDFPYFRRAVPPHHKSTWDNSDNLYLAAAIDGNATYRITGRAADSAHWRGKPRAKEGPVAPTYLIFSAITRYTGDSGGISELMPGLTYTTGFADIEDLEVDDDGCFELIAGPERPADWNGAFLSTKGEHEGEVKTATYIICRELFGDWERERNVAMDIVRVGKEGTNKPPISAAEAAEKLRRLGTIVNHQVRFWNDFYANILNGYGTSPLDLPVAFPGKNQSNTPRLPSAMIGAGQETNVNAGGMYELEPDEALIVEHMIPTEPLYTGFNLCNIWGESYDYANAQSSLNNMQVKADSDGKIRYVIAHNDPGVHNWLDTTGAPTGMFSQRWTYHAPPTELPTVATKKVKLAEVCDHLPADTALVTPEQRREQIRIRQEHTQRRYCQT